MNSVQIYSPDKFGFYQFENYKTYSKAEAMEYALRNSSKKCHFNFNDEVFSKIDTTKEPNIPLKDLYELRCRQIRNSYDYVVLFYSGGADSHNILMNWLNSGCKLDEVATIWSYDATRDKDSYSDAEQSHVAIPLIKELQKTHNFNFRLIDRSQIILDFINKEQDNMLYYTYKHTSPNNGCISYLRKNIKEWQDMIVAGKRLCFVWGKDKPLIRIIDNKFEFCFSDIMDGNVSAMVQQNYHQGWYDELFYWTPDLPELPIKQAHVVKKAILGINGKTIKNFIPKNLLENSHTIELPWNNIKIPQSVLATILYPYWDPNTFSCGKSPSLIYSRLDQWLWDGNLPEKNIFQSVIKRMNDFTECEYTLKQYEL
jgi:hypothetical protein